MNLSGLLGTLRNVIGQAAGKPASPASKAAAPAPVPTATPRPAAAPPRPVSAPAPSPVASSTGSAGSATLVRAVRAGGRTLAAGTVVKVVTVHGKGTAYTVQVPGLTTSKTIEGAAIRVG
jgi:hypothetical protein